MPRSMLTSWARAVLVLVLIASAPALGDDRPNFLIITSEDMSPDLGCYGAPGAITPNLDRLARKGNRYTAAFATGPICSPARTALLSGVHQSTLGAGNHRSRAILPADMLGFAADLRDAGYFATNHPKVDYNTPRAWEIERATYDRGQDWRAEGRDGRPFLSIINIAVSHQSYTSVMPFEGYDDLVRAQLPPELLHDPEEVVVPPYFPDTPAVRRELARYADCVTLMDREAGEILQRLEDDGLSDDTIVIYFSDHGAGHPRHKSTPFASGLRVPFIVYCPPKFQNLLRRPPGEAVDEVVTFLDIGPTVLSLAGVDSRSHLQGAPFLGGHAESGRVLYGSLGRRAESINVARTVSDGRFVYVRAFMPHIPFGQPKGYGFPSAIYQTLLHGHRAGTLTGAARDYMIEPPAELLFDLWSDPYETVNLARDPAFAADFDRLRSAMRERMRTIRDIDMVPEEELADRAGSRAWMDLAGELPLETIYGTAELVGRGTAGLDVQLMRTGNADSVVRWWAVVGLRSQDGTDPRVRSMLVGLLDDASPLVRTEAAGGVLSIERDHARARSVLLEIVSSDDARRAHRAAREVQLLRMNDDDAMAVVAAAARRHRTEWLGEVAAAMRRQRSGLE